MVVHSFMNSMEPPGSAEMSQMASRRCGRVGAPKGEEKGNGYKFDTLIGQHFNGYFLVHGTIREHDGTLKSLHGQPFYWYFQCGD